MVEQPLFTERQLKDAVRKQEEKTVNTWKPTLDTVDLGLNLMSMYYQSPLMYGASMAGNALQMTDDIYNNEDWSDNAVSLGFDTLGLLGSFNRLPTYRIKYKGREYTINTDKIADNTAKLWNLKDSAEDANSIYDFYNKVSSINNPNYIFRPFTK